MNSTLKLIAITFAGALLSTAALAGEGDDRALAVSPAAAKTRAQVQAEQAALPPVSSGDRYPILPETASTLTRAQVRAANADVKIDSKPGA